MNKENIAPAPLAVIKVGGRAAEPAALKKMGKEMAALHGEYRFLLVHGGGAEVSRISELFGLTPRFVDGVRLTSPDEMGVVDMVLAGKMNKDITRLLRIAGLNALGLSGSDGGLFTGRAVSDESHTGKVTAVNRVTLEVLLEGGFLPVVSSTSMDEAGKPLNINADQAALALAAAHPAGVLLFLSDIPGVLTGPALDRVIPRLDQQAILRDIAEGTITGGMIPKVNSAVEALNQGVGAVIIGQYNESGDLASLLQGDKGTRIVK